MTDDHSKYLDNLIRQRLGYSPPASPEQGDLDAAKRRIAAETGLSVGLVARLQGATVAELEADAVSLLDALAEAAGTAPKSAAETFDSTFRAASGRGPTPPQTEPTEPPRTTSFDGGTHQMVPAPQDPSMDSLMRAKRNAIWREAEALDAIRPPTDKENQ